MTRLLGSVLAGMVILQTGLPSIGLTEPVSNIAALAVAVVVAGVSFYLRDSTKV